MLSDNAINSAVGTKRTPSPTILPATSTYLPSHCTYVKLSQLAERSGAAHIRALATEGTRRSTDMSTGGFPAACPCSLKLASVAEMPSGVCPERAALLS